MNDANVGLTDDLTHFMPSIPSLVQKKESMPLYWR